MRAPTESGHRREREWGGGSPFARRPLVGLAVSFLTGTAAGLGTTTFPWVALGVGAGLCGLGLLWGRTGLTSARTGALQIRTIALHAGLFLVAFTAACPVLRGLTLVPPRGAEDRAGSEMAGVVIGDPDRVLEPDRHGRTWRVPFRIERWRDPDGAWVEVNLPATAWWRLPDWADVPRYGERYLLHEARWPAPGKGFWPPSFPIFNRQAEWLSRDHGNALMAWCYKARIRAAAHVIAGIEDFPEEAGIQQALTLGYRQRLSDRVSELGATTGTLHIFAISGSHVAIVAGICVFLLRALRLPRGRWIIILGPVLIAYTLSTGAQASAIRACVMAILCFLAPAMGRKPDGASALACSAMLIVAWDPTQIVDVGFVLSFVVVAGLIGLYPLFLRLMQPLSAPDPFAIEPPTGRVALVRAFGGAVVSLFALSLAAWLASVPLSAYYFERFTPISLLANLAVVPLAFLMVLCGCLSIVLGSACGLIAEIYNYASFALIRVFVTLTEWLSHVPLSNMVVPKPAVPWMLAYYGGLVAAAAWGWARLPRENVTPPIRGVDV
ncbi:MAG: ComEC/Rec2 family competence protein [Verrucomicrobia bacterium]|nr:ComEC/Rec2 family competence protein [Verrucomicrobiota bacterium]